MANICNFKMMVKGKRENIDTFIRMMEQKDSVWIGRGAEIFENEYEVSDDNCRCILDGCLKWSVHSSLVKSAIDMRENPSKWYFGSNPPEKIMTIYEACTHLELDMECYSRETDGCFFEEHYLFQDGELIEGECESITEEYDEDEDSYSLTGGFENWNFVI